MTPSPTPHLSPSPAFDPSVRHELKVSKDAEEWLKEVGPTIFKNYEDIQKLWNHPMTQFSVTLGRDAEFKAGITQMAESHAGARFYGYEALLILLLWIFRAWRLTKVNTILTRMWTQAWVGFCYWICALFLVPSLVWGESYRTTITHLIRAGFRHFFA